MLDLGCGPGTISVGLAETVHLGEVHGVDIEESQVELARAAAKAGGHKNLVFHVGDVIALPFDDSSFDAAHCHTVLTHVPDTSNVLSEVMRVLKPGGLVGCREMIASSHFLAPIEDKAARAWDMFARLIIANGGHPDKGTELNANFIQAGFEDIRTSASFDYFGTAEDVDFLRKFIEGWFLSPEVVAAVLNSGFGTQQDIDEWRSALDQWRVTPGACGAFAFGELIARKPQS